MKTKKEKRMRGKHRPKKGKGAKPVRDASLPCPVDPALGVGNWPESPVETGTDACGIPFGSPEGPVRH
jgi:hypothetical protein